MTEQICDNRTVLAVIQRAKEWEPGLHFFTADEYALQVGSWWYPAGKKLNSHKHRQNVREIPYTQECVYVVHGSMQVDIYNDRKQMINSTILNQGDLAILIAGGHGYTILSPDTKILEVKNGPFISAELDKEMIP
jgi:hypothetical protein